VRTYTPPPSWASTSTVPSPGRSLSAGPWQGRRPLSSPLLFPRIGFLTGQPVGLKAFTAAVLGGIGNIPGAVLGGYVLGLLEALGPSLVLAGLGIPAAWQLKDVLTFLVLILVLIFRPTGLLGERLPQDAR
jgi:branched-chain amino acid transport system permease protein